MWLVVALALVQGTFQGWTVAKGAASGIDMPRTVIVRTTAEWGTLWRDHAPGTDAPPVDFSAQAVVGVFLGSRPTAGYSVEIVRTVSRGAGLVVQYVESRPGKGAMTAQMLTAPYHLVAVAAGARDIQFEKVEN
ncbi:MAG: protease complex subunit PrcB family protein [Acidobacteriota bacterium]